LYLLGNFFLLIQKEMENQKRIRVSTKQLNMPTFNLELRVKEFGSILAREIFLEDVTDRNRRVRNWEQGDGFQFKRLPNFSIADASLEVFVGCQGIAGATVTCEVIINDKHAGEVVSRVEDRFFAQKSFMV